MKKLSSLIIIYGDYRRTCTWGRAIVAAQESQDGVIMCEPPESHQALDDIINASAESGVRILVVVCPPGMLPIPITGWPCKSLELVHVDKR
jgi:hypothetical protein